MQLLLFFAFFIILSRFSSAADFLYNNCMDIGGNYTKNSTFESNLNHLLASLSSNTPKADGFSNITFGEIPDRIFGLALCRGDISSIECSSCLREAAEEVTSLCFHSRAAILWYNQCFIRYSVINFFSNLDNEIKVYTKGEPEAPNPDEFNQALKDMIDAITKIAASNLTVATGRTTFQGFKELYGLVQCTRDLSTHQCFQCLEDSFSLMESKSYGQEGGYVLGLSCILFYDVNQFFDGIPVWIAKRPPINPPPATATRSLPDPNSNSNMSSNIKGNRNGWRKTPLVIVTIILMLSIITCFICFLLQRRRAKRQKSRKHIQGITGMDTMFFDLRMLKDATDNFSNAKKLGEGGFGAVYKGTLSDGRNIAVKRLLRYSEEGLRQLQNEIAFIANLHHRNLVRLLGCCLESEEKLLVYEYVCNKSLDKYITDAKRDERLNWQHRYKIIRGIAKGLLYLHVDSSVRLVHLDLKASNVLLDESMNPKISDFGLARLLSEGKSQTQTNNIGGTFGYMAPEYALHGKVSPKSDVFSFGVLTLEIISGRRNNDFYNSEHVVNLVSFAWECWTKNGAVELIDPSLREDKPNHEVLRCIHLGLLCVQEDPRDRPSMLQVAFMISRQKMHLKPPSQPAFYFRDSTTQSDRHGANSTRSEVADKHSRTMRSKPAVLFSQNGMSVTDLYPR